MRAETAPENAIEVPFSHDMGKNSTSVDIVKQYTTINANQDSRKWQVATVTDYSACMAPKDENVDANNDWLITVPIHMPAGKYTVSFDLGYMGKATGVTMEVKLGNAPTVEGMIAEIAPSQLYTEKEKATYQFNCAIPTEGYYYIGFHCLTTKAQNGTVKLFNVSVKEGEVVNVDPPAAGTLSWELAPKGELKATVTYIAPTKTKSGADLTEISKVEITSRWGVDTYTFNDVKPGQKIEQEVEMYAGSNNRFTGVAYVGETAGEKVEAKSIFCGPDTPLAPTNVKLTVADDYKSATLSWDPVGETGENGGYVDPTNVTYYIFDAFGSYYDPAISETKETSITIPYPELKGQDFVAYQVTAGYQENYSLDTSSDIVIVGEPAKLPFTESFTNGLFDEIWCFDPATTYSYQQYGTVDDSYFESLLDPNDPDAPEPLKSFDGDNGFYYWLPAEKDDMLGLMSLRADISAAANPVLEFWYQGQGSTIDVLVAAGKGNLSVVRTIDLQANPTTGWTKAQVPLSEFKSAGVVNFEIRLTATHNDDEHTWSVPLDNISIRDLVDTDMRLVASPVSKQTAKPGDTFTIGAHVQNQGTTASDATVDLFINDTLIETKKLGTIASNAFSDATFEYTVPLNAPEKLQVKTVVVTDGDAEESNNSSTVSDITVKYPNYPLVTNLTATPGENGTSVALAWDAPVLETPAPQLLTDDFESEEYTPMSITGAGGWTVYDGDKETTINVFREEYNPYQTMPMAFQLFNREVAQVPDEYWEDAEPHSGSTFMVAPTAYDATNDNWLISPELSGNAQTVSFYAKSFSIAWPESFEVRYSTTDNSRESFTDANILTVTNYPEDGAVPEVWTKYEVALPEGAKYFAIHHAPGYTCALLVDDVTYEAAPSLPVDLAITGYHVMRGNEMLTTEPITATTYVDNGISQDAGSHKYTYSVIPVYNYGTAKGTDVTISVQTSGIEAVAIDSLTSDERIYNLQGVLVSHERLTPGIYIRVSNGQAAKVALR